MVLVIPLVYSMDFCEYIMSPGDIPCLIVTAYPSDCASYEMKIYYSNSSNAPQLLDTRTLASYGDTGQCNMTFNYTTLGSYYGNSTEDTFSITIQEDGDMLIALVIGISLVVALFIILTFAVKEDKPFLANFFFLGIFIFTTVLSFLLWKITDVNSAPYEPVMFVVYRIFLIITMLMILIVLVLVTIDAVQLRKIKGNPVDNFRDNLGENEKGKF